MWPASLRPGWPARLGPVALPVGAVELRPLRVSDGAAWRSLRIADEALIRRWDPTSTDSWRQRHTRAAWVDHRSVLRLATRRGVALPFAITVDGNFAGQVTVGGIQRAPVHGGWIGYWVSSTVSGRGVASAAVALALRHAFGAGQLHRVEATVAPANTASQAVLRRLGFRQEGLLERYLDIDGAWRDHQLWAMTAEDPARWALDRVVARVEPDRLM